MTLFKNTILLLAFTAAHQAVAQGDAARGEKLYNRCSSCHAIIKDGDVLVKGGITGPISMVWSAEPPEPNPII